jgi:phage gp36-like protein
LDVLKMPYATQDDLLARFGENELLELTDRDNTPPADINPARIDVAIADAVSEIDGYLAQRYRLPLTGCQDGSGGMVAPPRLTALACDIAHYNLYHDLAPEHEVYRRYQAAIETLAAIASGDLLLACPLGDAPGEILPLAGAGETAYNFAPRQVTDASLKGFI